MSPAVGGLQEGTHFYVYTVEQSTCRPLLVATSPALDANLSSTDNKKPVSFPLTLIWRKHVHRPDHPLRRRICRPRRPPEAAHRGHAHPPLPAHLRHARRQQDRQDRSYRPHALG